MDDTYLGYIGLPELRGLLAGASPGNAGRAGCAGAVFAELVAECLACRAPEIVDLGCGFLAEADAWASARCLHEAMSVGQDPDCRGNVRALCPFTPFRRENHDACMLGSPAVACMHACVPGH